MLKRGAFLWCVLLLSASIGVQGDAKAQTAPCHLSAPPHFDARLSVGLYCAGQPVPALSRIADRTAVPVFLGAPVVTGGYALATRSQDRVGDAYRLGLSMTGAYALTFSLKRLIRRPRPYAAGLVTRRDGPQATDPAVLTLDDRTSMPSGHATLATAMAVSWSLSHPRWYVIAPAATWATGTSLSRVHLGVHYVSDIAVGAVIGSGTAVLIHHLGDAITPTIFNANEGAGPQIQIVVPL